MSRDTDYSVLFNQLLEVDGPFLTVPVARGAFGKLLEKTEQELVDELRIARQELVDDETLLRRWVRWVLSRLLDFEDEVLVEGPPIAHLSHLGPEGVTLRPDLALLDPEADGTKPVMLVTEWPADQPLNRKAGTDRWTASPITRLIELCQATKIPLGLTTNGESWTLIHAPADGVVSTVNWEAELWLDERETLDLFVAVLGAQRFFGVEAGETLPALLADSADGAQEVTTTLGRQVRRSVELLVAALSEANRERHGELLADVPPDEVYRGAVTVLMRLVFLLSAEERDLFLLGDEVYDAHYAISTLLDQLETEPDADVLFGRYDAWPRVLATFRLIHGGVQHDDRLHLPAYGGRLFDPDRFPFLEGRVAGQPFDDGSVDERLLNAINNRVMLEVLRSLQRLSLDRFNETRRLSFRHLDVEQIGTVYEGLLDHTCVVASEPTLGLLAKRSRTKGNTEPEIALSALEEAAADGRTALEKWLTAEHGFNKTELRKLDAEPDELQRARLLSACGNDAELVARVEPFFGVLRIDLRGLPTVFLTDSFVVTDSTERGDTGAHYTHRSTAEQIVTHALEPLVYEPGPHNEGDRELWQLRPWSEIVDLKVVDPACGSGAMLVSACRFLADRLVEAWAAKGVESGVALPLPGAQGAPLTLPSDDADERKVVAMRVVADRCLYGVDVNDMAVEMCKLSLWLATLAKGKPFSFLDHSIQHGDSLLGLADLNRLNDIGSDASGTSSLLLERLRTFVDRARDKRLDLLAMPTIDARDLDEKARLLAEADRELGVVTTVADAFTGALLSTADLKTDERENRMAVLADDVAGLFGDDDEPDSDALDDLAQRAVYWLDTGRPAVTPDRVPFHWPLAFPEVLLGGRGRFDATVSNPPFLGGQKLTGTFGTNYRELLVAELANGIKGSADLVAYFFLRACQVAGVTGYVATNTVAQGVTSDVGLQQLIDGGSTIYRAVSSAPWPGDASVEVSLVWLTQRAWDCDVMLDGGAVDAIDEMLYRRSPSGWRKQALAANADQSFQGSNVVGMGFVMSPDQAKKLIDVDERNRDVLFPYLGGEDLNQSPTLTAPRWIINFFDWPESEARNYSACFDIVEEKVKPVRATNNRKVYRENWWRYAERRKTLYETIDGLERVLAICLLSKSVAPVFVPSGAVFSHQCGVFPYDDDFHFGVLSSGFHYRWAVRYASSLENRLRYTPTDVFETFPQPKFAAEVEATGQELDEHRSARMIEANEGLTDTYNRVHSPDDRTPEIIRLRELHVELDHAVADAYGWSDLDLDHGFHPVRGQGIRYTFSPDAAVEALYRLLELNRTRYEEEVAQGLHDKKSGARKKKTKSVGATKPGAQAETLFE